MTNGETVAKIRGPLECGREPAHYTLDGEVFFLT